MRWNLDRTIAAIYESSLDGDRWPNALSQLCADMQGQAAQIYYWDKVEGRVDLSQICRELDPALAELYNTEYAATDPRREVADRLPVGEFFACHERLDDDFVRHSPIYQEYLIPMGLGYCLGGRLAETAEYACYLGLNRSRFGRPWLTDEQDAFRSIIPHIQRGAEIHRRLFKLDLLDSLWRQAVDRLPFAMILVDATNRIVDFNAAAERLFRTGDGLTNLNGRLVAGVPKEADRLAELVTQAAGARTPSDHRRGGSLAVSRNGSGAPYTLLVTPLAVHLPMASVASSPLALILVTDPGRRSAELGQHLIAVHGLTQAEAVMVNTLINGRTLDDYAAEARISKETARWRLREVFAKTGTHRQHELTALVLKSFANLGF